MLVGVLGRARRARSSRSHDLRAPSRRPSRQVDPEPQAALADLEHGRSAAASQAARPPRRRGAPDCSARLPSASSSSTAARRRRRPAGCRRRCCRARPGAITPSTSSLADDRRQRHDPAAERLAEHVEVGHDVLVVAGERAPGAPEAGLDLVGDQQDAVPRRRSRAPRAGSPSGGTITPASPWIGSTRKPTVSRRDRRRAARPRRRRARVHEARRERPEARRARAGRRRTTRSWSCGRGSCRRRR